MNKPGIDPSQLELLLVSGGIWCTPPVEQQPIAHLESWRVYEVGDGDRHLVGWCTEEGAGRVTSFICEFDPALSRCTTRSGRLYELVGAAGFNSDADYVWRRWKEANRVTVCVDVTDDVERLLGEQSQADGEAR